MTPVQLRIVLLNIVSIAGKCYNAHMITPQEVLDFWFGEIIDEWTTTDRHALWFGARPADDEIIRTHFGEAMEQAVAGGMTAWEQKPMDTLALIILLDQMTRVIGRGRAAAFAGDKRALSLCLAGISNGFARQLPMVAQMFFYLPLEHSELLSHQEKHLALYADMIRQCPARKKELTAAFDYARKHMDIIARFGRFPHRNAALGRVNTPAEETYLQNTNESFGQGKGG